jgi:hypothetical protein
VKTTTEILNDRIINPDPLMPQAQAPGCEELDQRLSFIHQWL